MKLPEKLHEFDILKVYIRNGKYLADGAIFSTGEMATICIDEEAMERIPSAKSEGKPLLRVLVYQEGEKFTLAEEGVRYKLGMSFSDDSTTTQADMDYAEYIIWFLYEIRNFLWTIAAIGVWRSPHISIFCSFLVFLIQVRNVVPLRFTNLTKGGIIESKDEGAKKKKQKKIPEFPPGYDAWSDNQKFLYQANKRMYINAEAANHKKEDEEDFSVPIAVSEQPEQAKQETESAEPAAKPEKQAETPQKAKAPPASEPVPEEPETPEMDAAAVADIKLSAADLGIDEDDFNNFDGGEDFEESPTEFTPPDELFEGEENDDGPSEDEFSAFEAKLRKEEKEAPEKEPVPQPEEKKPSSPEHQKTKVTDASPTRASDSFFAQMRDDPQNNTVNTTKEPEQSSEKGGSKAPAKRQVISAAAHSSVMDMYRSAPAEQPTANKDPEPTPQKKKPGASGPIACTKKTEDYYSTPSQGEPKEKNPPKSGKSPKKKEKQQPKSFGGGSKGGRGGREKTNPLDTLIRQSDPDYKS